MSPTIRATLYSDPACPWAYSAIPALRVLEWRYGSQLEWRLVLIGLSEDAAVRRARLHAAARCARPAQLPPLRDAVWRRSPKNASAPAAAPAVRSSPRGCSRPGDEWRVFRALQLANFTTPLLLDDDRAARSRAGTCRASMLDAIVAQLDDPEVTEAYERDKAEARGAAGSAAELQGKTAASDGPVRYTAPSVIFEADGRRLVAGGFQPIEAYDVLVANLDPELRRQPVPETPQPLLERFSDGLTTQEVAALMTDGNDSRRSGRRRAQAARARRGGCSDPHHARRRRALAARRIRVGEPLFVV